MQRLPEEIRTNARHFTTDKTPDRTPSANDFIKRTSEKLLILRVVPFERGP
jgi:hypothetical protein